MPNSLSKIVLPNNQQYDIKDPVARNHIVVSSTEPSNQKTGDAWFVIEDKAASSAPLPTEYHHIVFSSTQPTNQRTGDIWVVIEDK